MTDITTAIAVDREHLAELRAVWPTWQRWHPEICENVISYADLNEFDHVSMAKMLRPQEPELCGFFRPSPLRQLSQKDKMLGGLLTEVPQIITTDHWLKIDCDTIATGPGPPLTDLVEGVESIAASPWPYSKPVDSITQLN